MAKNLQKTLQQILNLSGVTAVSLISRDGFVVDYVSHTDVDLEAIGAVIASGFGASEVIGIELTLGYLNQCILEYDTNKIVMAAVSDNVLAVITEGDAIIGQIRYNIQKIITQIAKALS